MKDKKIVDSTIDKLRFATPKVLDRLDNAGYSNMFAVRESVSDALSDMEGALNIINAHILLNTYIVRRDIEENPEDYIHLAPLDFTSIDLIVDRSDDDDDDDDTKGRR